MELSITRSKAALLVAGAAAFGWYTLGGGGPLAAPSDVPAALREVLPGAARPAAPPPAAGRPRAPEPTPPPPAPPDAAATPAAEDDPATALAPAEPVRTPDERARSKIALAGSYADNGRFDRAFEVLEEAEAFAPGPAVMDELEAAREQVTALMRAGR